MDTANVRLSDSDSETKDAATEDRKFRFKAAAFLTGVTGISVLLGFGSALASAKKKDPQYFQEGLTGTMSSPSELPENLGNSSTKPKVNFSQAKVISESGASLALRALGLGTLYAVTGCSLLFFGIWKAMGVQTMQEFRLKIGTILPSVPRNNPPQGRTEFEGLTDLLTYLSELGKADSTAKPSSPPSPD